MRLGSVDADVVRAVHRLQQEALHRAVGQAVRQFAATAAFLGEHLHRLALDEWRELGVLIIREVTRSAVEVEVADVRREDLLVASLEETLGDEVLELLTDDGAIRRPEDEALPHLFVDMEKLQFLAQLAVIALLGFLGADDGLLEFVLGRVGGTVDALELLVLLVATVIGASDVQELERLDLRGVTDVGAGAEVDELAVLIKGDGFAGGDVTEAADLVGILSAFEDQLLGFLAGALEAFELLVLLGDTAHLFLNFHEVLGRESVVEVEVVVEAVVGGRPDIQLGLREQAEHGGAQHVGGGVANLLEGSHLRAGGHGGIPHSLGVPEAEGKDGANALPCLTTSLVRSRPYDPASPNRARSGLSEAGRPRRSPWTAWRPSDGRLVRRRRPESRLRPWPQRVQAQERRGSWRARRYPDGLVQPTAHPSRRAR